MCNLIQNEHFLSGIVRKFHLTFAAGVSGHWATNVRRLLGLGHALRECDHRPPLKSQARMIASQKRPPQKPAAKAHTPTVARKINEPSIKEWLNCSARETPEKTPNTTPQVNCVQKLPRPCLYSSCVIALKRPNESAATPGQSRPARETNSRCWLMRFVRTRIAHASPFCAVLPPPSGKSRGKPKRKASKNSGLRQRMENPTAAKCRILKAQRKNRRQKRMWRVDRSFPKVS